MRFPSSHSQRCIHCPIEKRAAAQKAEADFFVLLKEKGNILPGSVWKEVASSDSCVVPATNIPPRSSGNSTEILDTTLSARPPSVRSFSIPS